MLNPTTILLSKSGLSIQSFAKQAKNLSGEISEMGHSK